MRQNRAKQTSCRNPFSCRFASLLAIIPSGLILVALSLIILPL